MVQIPDPDSHGTHVEDTLTAVGWAKKIHGAAVADDHFGQLWVHAPSIRGGDGLLPDFLLEELQARVRIAGVCRSYLVMFHDANELKNHLKVGMLIPADLAGCPLSG